MTMMGKTCPVRARAFSLSWDKRARRAAMPPLRTACLDIFSPPPGAREVMTQVERLSSRDTKIALRSVRIAACSSGRGKRARMVAPEYVVQHPHSAREQGATNRTHGISTINRPKMREPRGSSGGRLAVNSECRRGRHSHLYRLGEDEENGDQQIDYSSRPGSHACD